MDIGTEKQKTSLFSVYLCNWAGQVLAPLPFSLVCRLADLFRAVMATAGLLDDDSSQSVLLSSALPES